MTPGCGGWSTRDTPEANAQARQLFERATVLDPQYAAAYAQLGWTYYVEWAQWNRVASILERAEELARQALTLDDGLPVAHLLLGRVYQQGHQQHAQAIAEAERALALDPNNAEAHMWLANILSLADRAGEGASLAQQAMRLNPRAPDLPFHLGLAYYWAGQYTEAIATFKEAQRRNPNNFYAYNFLALSYLAQWGEQWSHDPQTLDHAQGAVQQAVARSDSFYTHAILRIREEITSWFPCIIHLCHAEP